MYIPSFTNMCSAYYLIRDLFLLSRYFMNLNIILILQDVDYSQFHVQLVMGVETASRCLHTLTTSIRQYGQFYDLVNKVRIYFVCPQLISSDHHQLQPKRSLCLAVYLYSIKSSIILQMTLFSLNQGGGWQFTTGNIL